MQLILYWCDVCNDVMAIPDTSNYQPECHLIKMKPITLSDTNLSPVRAEVD